MLHLLADEHLIEAYYAAVHLNLEKEFIYLLEEELERRELDFRREATMYDKPLIPHK